MKFQELLEIINKYKGEGQDYTHFWGKSGNRNSGEIFEKTEIYEIYSSQFKKEARGLMLNGDTEDAGFCRVGREIGGKWYEYEKGDGNRPDKLEIKNVKPEEIRSRKEQMERDREELEKNRKELEEQRKEWEKSFEKSEKKCAFCKKVIDSGQGIWSIGQTGKEKNRLYFCATDNCLEKHTEQKNRNRNDNNWKKCDRCGSTWEDGMNVDGYWGYLIVDGKTYCDGCSEKLPKKQQSEQEKVKLNTLKSKLQNSSNPVEKEVLQNKVRETQSRLKDLESKDKSKNNSNQPNEDHGKLLLIGAVIFIPVVILVSILVVRIRKDNKRKNQ